MYVIEGGANSTVAATVIPFQPSDNFSSDGHILQRGLLEVELADEYAGRFDRFYDPTNPQDVHLLTLNVYIVAPDHENGMGRVLIPGCSAVTETPANAPDSVVRDLLKRITDRLETYGVNIVELDPESPPELAWAVEELSFVNPQWSNAS